MGTWSLKGFAYRKSLLDPAQPAKRVCAQSCLTLCDPMDCSPPGSSVHEIFQARILEWIAISFSKVSSRPRDGTHVSCVFCTAGRFFTTAPPGKPPVEHALLHKCVLMTGNTAHPNHRHLHAVFRTENERCVVICHPGLPRDQEQMLRWSTRIQNAISDCVVVFCHASLISSCGGQGYGAVLVSTLPRLFTLYKDQKHTENGGEYQEMALYFNFFHKVKAL